MIDAKVPTCASTATRQRAARDARVIYYGKWRDMDILLIVLFIVLIGIASKRSATSTNISSRIWIWVIIVGIPVLIFFTDEMIGQAYLHIMCKRFGGYEYKEPVKAEGFFDIDNDSGCRLGCLEALTRWNFKYYETEVRSRTPYHAHGAGIYRYYLVDRTSGHCAGGREIPREKSILPEDKCVAYSKLREPGSRYEVSTIQTSNIKDDFMKVDKVSSYVKDRKTGEFVGSATSFRYWGGWVRNHSYAENSASVCPSFNDSHAAIHNLIITATD